MLVQIRMKRKIKSDQISEVYACMVLSELLVNYDKNPSIMNIIEPRNTIFPVGVFRNNF